MADSLRQLNALTVWAVLAVGAAYLFLFAPGQTGFFPTCPFRTLTGFTCPGCGSTRALHQLLHGHVVAAFELNPLLLLALPFLIAMLLLYTRAAFRDEPMPSVRLPRPYVWAGTALIVGFWIGRNVPGYPFPV